MSFLKNFFLNMTKVKALIISAVLATIITIMVVVFIVMPGKEKQDNDKKNIVKETKTETPVPTATENPHKGKVKSRWTGLWIDENMYNNRPYAVMFNNIKVASPQSGTSQADILYEAVVEGGITRLMGIFSKIDTDRLGSLRSARPYYVSIAKEYDALYIHVGGSDDAKKKIGNLEVADLDGNGSIGGTLMYRDKSIKAPHNAFASSKRIKNAIEKKKYHLDYQGKEDNHFTFNDEVKDIEGKDASNKITIFFSSYTNPYFTYNKDKKLYYRYQFGEKHIDYNTKKQLSFTNIIIQYVKQWSYDSKDRQAMDIYDSKGEGVYISTGKCQDITWKRNEDRLTMQYIDESGKFLQINPGKTYIALVPKDNESKTKID